MVVQVHIIRIFGNGGMPFITLSLNYNPPLFFQDFLFFRYHMVIIVAFLFQSILTSVYLTFFFVRKAMCKHRHGFRFSRATWARQLVDQLFFLTRHLAIHFFSLARQLAIHFFFASPNSYNMIFYLKHTIYQSPKK